MRISVLTVTNRYGGIDILLESLIRQDFPHNDFELVLVDDYDGGSRHQAILDAIKASERVDFGVKVLKSVPYEAKKASGLCRAYNSAFLHCSGDLIVSLQDYIWVPEQGLRRFWELSEQFSHFRLISGRHDRYLLCPNHRNNYSQVDTKSGLQRFDHWCGHRPGVKRTWTDSRLGIDTIEPGVNYEHVGWETNWAAIPWWVVEELGGIDESYDEGRGYDNQNLSARAGLLGVPTCIDRMNYSLGFEHNELLGETVSDASNREYHEAMVERLRKGEVPIRQDWLTRLREGHV